jgi:flagellar protein FlbD
MIELTRLQGQKIVINVELIEFIEETPDTLITTTTGKKLMVKESVREVIRKAVMYRRRCLQRARRMYDKL